MYIVPPQKKRYMQIYRKFYLLFIKVPFIFSTKLLHFSHSTKFLYKKLSTISPYTKVQQTHRSYETVGCFFVVNSVSASDARL